MTEEVEPEPEPSPEEAPVEEPVAEEPAAEEPLPRSLSPKKPRPRSLSPRRHLPKSPLPPRRAASRRPTSRPPRQTRLRAEGAALEPRVARPATRAEAEEEAAPAPERHKHSKPKREPAAQRKPITRLPKPEGERGRDQQRRGVVVSAAMDKTIVVRVDSVKAHPKYKKVIRRSKKFHAHDEQNQAKAGDVVRIVETRPLSKTKRWRLAEILEVAK